MLSGISSRGHTADGRVKPELLAMGEGTISVWPYDDVQYASADGTSLSTPLVAGAVACLVGARPGWSVATLRERLMDTAGGFAVRPDPLFATGFGIVDSVAALALAGSWQSLGGGVAGVQGVPLLAVSGDLVGTEATTLALSSGKPSGAAFLVLGVSPLMAPFRGGTLVPNPDIVLAGLPIDALGALDISFLWPTGVPAGVVVAYQYWITDAGGPVGFSASNGLTSTTP